MDKIKTLKLVYLLNTLEVSDVHQTLLCLIFVSFSIKSNVFAIFALYIRKVYIISKNKTVCLPKSRRNYFKKLSVLPLVAMTQIREDALIKTS